MHPPTMPWRRSSSVAYLRPSAEFIGCRRRGRRERSGNVSHTAAQPYGDMTPRRLGSRVLLLAVDPSTSRAPASLLSTCCRKMHESVNGNAVGTSSTLDLPDRLAASPASLLDTCSHISAKVNALLAANPATDELRRVQTQTRTSLRVLEEALNRFT